MSDRPSNAAEGMMFESKWCADCPRDAGDGCPIIFAAMTHELGEEGYPSEWAEFGGGPRVAGLYGDVGCVCLGYEGERDDLREAAAAVRRVQEGGADE